MEANNNLLEQGLKNVVKYKGSSPKELAMIEGFKGKY